MLQSNGYIVACSLAVLAFACVATPRQTRELEAARVSIRHVESLPLADEVARGELEEARSALQYAESLAKQRGPTEDIEDAAILANRHATIAEQQIALEQAKRNIDLIEKERREHERNLNVPVDQEVDQENDAPPPPPALANLDTAKQAAANRS